MKSNTSFREDMLSRSVQLGKHSFPVYILTLPVNSTKALEKRKEFEYTWRQVFQVQHMDPFFFYGLDGRKHWGVEKWKQAALKDLIKRGYVKPLSGPGLCNLKTTEVAIAIGFLQICVSIVCSGAPFALYLEDDAKLLMTDQQDRCLDPRTNQVSNQIRFQQPMEFRRKLTHVIDTINSQSYINQWDVVRLGAFFSRNHQKISPVFKEPTLFLTHSKFSLSTHAILISKRAAQTFVEKMFPLYTTLDHQILHICQDRSSALVELEVLPHIVGQDIFLDPSVSTIGYSSTERVILRLLLILNVSPRCLMNMNLHIKRKLMIFANALALRPESIGNKHTGHTISQV